MGFDSFPSALLKITQAFYHAVPSTQGARKFTDDLVEFLFPLRANRSIDQSGLEGRWQDLQRDFIELISPVCPEGSSFCEDTTGSLFEQLPIIYTELVRDAELFYKCDPAAFCPEEIILCYPGFYAVTVHRIAHAVHKLGVPILPRVLAEYAHSQTGIDIHPGATIGKGFYIDHGTGIVIGETCIIGDNVKIYQGVTLGATFVEKELQGVVRHPKIEDNVVIYAGSTILGGETVVGHDSVIGGNVWLTESVPPWSKVYHKPEIVIRERTTAKHF